MRNITVGYLRPKKESFISNIINTNNFLEALSHYVKVITITTDLKSFQFSKLKNLNTDYLLVDIKNFGPMQFILREKQGIDIPFIIILRTIYPWLGAFIPIIPLIRKEDIIIAPSEYARKSFLKIAAKSEVHIIPHCLDTKQIKENISYNLKNQRKEISFMGRLTENKGIGNLISCMPEIISKVGDAHLNIIGPLSGGRIDDARESLFVKRLERQAKNLGLTNNVHFIGLKLGLEKYKILSESNIFINPTTTEEDNFPVVNIEALACGVPIIASRWAGNKEIVKDGKDGYLVDIVYDKNKKAKIDNKKLISLIIKVLRNKDLNLKLKENAMEAAKKFDYRKVMPKLAKLLEKRTKVKIRNRWRLIKHKSVIDFNQFFNRDFLFFLYYSHHFKTETYALIYRRLTRTAHFKNKNYLDVKKTLNRNSGLNQRLNDKVRRALLDSLLLKCD